MRWSWSVSHITSTEFCAACARWASTEPDCSLKDVWTCMAIETAVVSSIPDAVETAAGSLVSPAGSNRPPAAAPRPACSNRRRDT